MSINNSSVLALDVGTVRIGVAVADALARLPRPLITLPNDETFIVQLRQIIATEKVSALVVGLPRSLDGEDTDQTRLVREFVAGWQSLVDLPITYQDEALSSSRAKEELLARGRPYAKGDVDALAATFILDDFIATQTVTKGA